MILSDRHNFVFIHVPKCAGTSVREAILPFHDTDSRFLKAVEVHPELGEIDFRHLPLKLLRALDPEAFEKLMFYEGYALLRDPFQRFWSALAQRTKMYLGKEFAQLSEEDIRTETEKIIAYLQSEPRVIAPDFIHFSRQSEYVQINGEQLVHNIYPVERLDLFVAALGRHIGTDTLEIGHANKTTVFRHPYLKHAMYKGSALARRVLPGSAYETLRQSARGVLMKPTDHDVSRPVFDEAGIQGFISDYYAVDIMLHRELLTEMAV